MEWKKLLKEDKFIENKEQPEVFEKYIINEFDKDFRKIVSSAPFRRLQDKTQVFPLDKSDFIRTRLTHSLEVSAIGRQLGIMLCKDTSQYAISDWNDEEKENIPAILACAGLLHDLENPPFGHFGDTTISDWFRKNLGKIKFDNKPLTEMLTEQMKLDLMNFEGMRRHLEYYVNQNLVMG